MGEGALHRDMEKKGHNHRLKMLKEEFKLLKLKYRRFNAALGTSGKGKITWEYWDDMRRLMQDKASSNPILTLNAGSMVQVKARPEAKNNKRSAKGASTTPTSTPTSWQENLANNLSLLVSRIVNNKK